MYHKYSSGSTALAGLWPSPQDALICTFPSLFFPSSNLYFHQILHKYSPSFLPQSPLHDFLQYSFSHLFIFHVPRSSFSLFNHRILCNLIHLFMQAYSFHIRYCDRQRITFCGSLSPSYVHIFYERSYVQKSLRQFHNTLSLSMTPTRMRLDCLTLRRSF